MKSIVKKFPLLFEYYIFKIWTFPEASRQAISMAITVGTIVRESNVKTKSKDWDKKIRKYDQQKCLHC